MNYKSLTERIVLCESWKRSGLTKVRFCRQNNIGKRTFYTWLKQLRNNGNNTANDAINVMSDNDTVNVISDSVTTKTDPIKFLRVCHAVPQRSFSLEAGSLEISLANGLVVKAAISQDNINNFLQELLKWK